MRAKQQELWEENQEALEKLPWLSDFQARLTNSAFKLVAAYARMNHRDRPTQRDVDRAFRLIHCKLQFVVTLGLHLRLPRGGDVPDGKALEEWLGRRFAGRKGVRTAEVLQAYAEDFGVRPVRRTLTAPPAGGPPDAARGLGLRHLLTLEAADRQRPPKNIAQDCAGTTISPACHSWTEPRRTTVSLDDLILTVFCRVDDELRALAHDDLRRRGPQPLLADSEVITMELVGEFLGFDRDSRLSWYFRQHHGADFPALQGVHRTTFVRQAANLGRAKQLLQSRLAQHWAGPASAWLVDSLPVPVCRFGRGGFCQGFRGQAGFGYDPVQKQAYYGFRLHLRTSRRGVLLDYELAPAEAADTAVLFELPPSSGTTGIGDRNYWSPPVQDELAAVGVRLLSPYKSKKHDPDPQRSRQLSGPRWRIETVGSQLTERYRLKRVWARDLWHLCHRLIRKVLSHTMAVWLNSAAGLEPLPFSANLAA
jgi:hypothetical protein